MPGHVRKARGSQHQLVNGCSVQGQRCRGHCIPLVTRRPWQTGEGPSRAPRPLPPHAGRTAGRGRRRPGRELARRQGRDAHPLARRQDKRELARKQCTRQCACPQAMPARRQCARHAARLACAACRHARARRRCRRAEVLRRGTQTRRHSRTLVPAESLSAASKQLCYTTAPICPPASGERLSPGEGGRDRRVR